MLGTWFQCDRVPPEVTAVVDEHSINIARYAHSLSKFETRWGTLTNPWQTQPQPKCEFILVVTRGTISSYDYDRIVCVQTAAHPAGERASFAAPQLCRISHSLSGKRRRNQRPAFTGGVSYRTANCRDRTPLGAGKTGCRSYPVTMGVELLEVVS